MKTFHYSRCLYVGRIRIREISSRIIYLVYNRLVWDNVHFEKVHLGLYPLIIWEILHLGRYPTFHITLSGKKLYDGEKKSIETLTESSNSGLCNWLEKQISGIKSITQTTSSQADLVEYQVFCRISNSLSVGYQIQQPVLNGYQV